MTLRLSALESAALERRMPPVRALPLGPGAGRAGSRVRAVENSMMHDPRTARDLARRGRSRASRGRRLGPARGPRALPHWPLRNSALRNTRQDGRRGTRPDLRRAASGGVRCLVDPVRGGVDRRHAPDTYHAPHYEWFIAVHAHTRYAHDPTAKNILSHHRRPSCIHTCITPKPPEGKAPAARQLFGRPAPRRQLCPRQGHKCATRHRL
jgi:hypothetical protein